MSDEQPVEGINEEALERIRATLESIARGFSEDSDEYRALCTATKAIHFVARRQLLREFDDYLSGKALTEAQREHIRRMGLSDKEN